MNRSAGRISTVILLLVVVGAAVIAYQQTERANQAQTAIDAVNATAQAESTSAMGALGDASATLAAIEESARNELNDVRSAASTLQAGSLGTRTGLEAQVEGLQASATEAAQQAGTAAADAARVNETAVAFATGAAATQSAQATTAADQAAELAAVQDARASLAEAATANAALIATQEIAIAALSTQVAQAQTLTTVEPTAAPTARVVVTPTSGAVDSDARVRRDAFLRAFPVPLVAGGVEWSIADDPEFRVDEAEEASIGLLLVNEAGERTIFAVYFGNNADRYRALAEQAIPALGLTPLEEQPDGFPTPSIFGQSEQTLEAVWVQGTMLARVTLAVDTQDGEVKLVALARALLELLSDA